MACNSPLRHRCDQLDIGAGFLYRRKGNTVRENDTEGVSCCSSAYTLQITGSEICDWKQGMHCRRGEEHLCDGSESNDKCLKWRLPIPSLRFEAVGSQEYSFDATWRPTRCDQAHCIIAIMANGQVVSHFSTLTELVRLSIDRHLKRSTFS